MQLWDVTVEGYFLNGVIDTSLFAPITAPFFLDAFSSKKDLRRYLLDDGEAVKHLVKSDLVP